ncbi:hypothetical protein I7I53_03328 [Histoplasma capsulatum var. duboisii H88]|uniref:Uncharacterized protein n=1 Tax=Ajellomyces capsulatus (strain H88) TaxID=544711 RepID=A0A8A1LSR2_AJEC8|nr:hypothetical protein I7I53_03328 [Histoplasma capsulatum var. duboisii H88]
MLTLMPGCFRVSGPCGPLFMHVLHFHQAPVASPTVLRRYSHLVRPHSFFLLTIMESHGVPATPL